MAKKTLEKPKKKLGRPVKAAKEKSRPISASLPPAEFAALEQYERANSVTRSQAVTEAIRRLVG